MRRSIIRFAIRPALDTTKLNETIHLPVTNPCYLATNYSPWGTRKMIYDYPLIDIQREIEKKVSRKLKGLDHDQRLVAQRIVDGVTSQVIFDNVSTAINHKYSKDLWAGKRPNIHFFNEGVNAALDKIFNRIKRRQQMRETQTAEFVDQLTASFRSICRRMDPLAKCWKQS